MPTLERFRLPRLPPAAYSLLRSIGPETPIVISRLAEQGGRYAPLEGSVLAGISPRATTTSVAEAITKSVTADGAAFFRIKPEGGRAVNWYAFLTEDVEGEAEDPYVEANIPDDALVPGWVLKLHVNSYFALTHRMESLLDMCIANMEQAREDHASSMEQMRRAISESSEATTRALELDHRKDVLELGIQALEMLRGKGAGESKIITGILSNVQRLMDPADFDALRASGLGSKLWDVTDIESFKEHARAVYDAVMRGELKFSSTTMANLGPYLAKVVGTVVGAAA